MTDLAPYSIKKLAPNDASFYCYRVVDCLFT